MLHDGCIPEIETYFDDPSDNANIPLYTAAIRNTLKKILPDEVFNVTDADPDILADQCEHFHASLPLVSCHFKKQAPTNLSIYVIYKYRLNAFKFFIEMISRWLIPGKKLNVILVYAADFKIPSLSSECYTLGEAMIRVETQQELEEIQRNLPIIETELCLGVESNYYACRILEVKGHSSEEKTSHVQERLAYLMRRLPKVFDIDILTEMQHVLVMCKDDFKTIRDARHLGRIISVHYLFRKNLNEEIKRASEQRHLAFKLFKTKLHLLEGEKTVLAILVGVNFLKDKEIFEKRHLMTAILNYIPTAQAIEDSFFANRRGSETISTLYLEIEKNNGEEFTLEEIQVLRSELPIDLKDRIEHLMHPVFMPRNEEEIMRNVLSLASQIKYLRDMPQVAISFDEQTHANLFFTVILVRVTTPESESIEMLFQNAKTCLTYDHDRCKIVGYLRKKYPKEATVFRVKLSKEKFLRRDHSIDLYKARYIVFTELCRIVGEVRDFNGGMISKQNELLCAVRNLLGEKAKYNDLLLENFFYSLTPVMMRTVLEPQVLSKLFLMQLDAIDEGFFAGERYALKMQSDPNFVYVMIKARNRHVKEELGRLFKKLQVPSTDLAHSYVKIYDTPYIGYLYRCTDLQMQRYFCQKIHNTVQTLEYMPS